MDIVAKLNYYRVAPRKVRLATGLVRGEKISDALNRLLFSKKKSSLMIAKLLKSAVSNAKHNFKIEDGNSLYVKKITVDEGKVLKRHRPRSRGMANQIKKRTSHITVVLGEKAEIKKQKTKKHV